MDVRNFIRPPFLITGAGFMTAGVLGTVGRALGLAWPWIIVGVLGVAVIFVVVSLVRKLRAAQQSQKMQDELTQPADDVNPDEEPEFEAYAKDLSAALEELEQAKTNRGKSRKTALYSLPWYMVIGPPASGKTEVLKQAALDWHMSRNQRDRGEDTPSVVGAGGTRFCDYWFGDEAIFVDTAGRLSEHQDPTRDRAEWHKFLDLLRKHRRHRPVNGAIVVVPVDRLMEGQENAEELAKNLRERLDEMTERLGISFPVYVIFNKCDLVRGFVEFFQGLSKAEREAIWGTTVAVQENVDRAADAMFRDERRVLQRALSRARFSRVAHAMSAPLRPDIVLFSSQYRALGKTLEAFIGVLFKENRYVERPIMRGMYFTSATQEGRPLDYVIGKMLQAMGMEPAAPAAEEETDVGSSDGKKNYFIKRSLTDVAIPDQHLAGPSADEERRGRRRRAMVFGLGSVATLGFAALLIFNTIGFHRYLDRVQESAIEIVEARGGNVRDFQMDDIRQFERLRDKLEGMASRSSLLRRTAGLFTYQGDPVEEQARDTYLRAFRRATFEEVIKDLRRNLDAYAREGAHAPLSSYLGWYKSWRTLTATNEFLDRESAPAVSRTLADFFDGFVASADSAEFVELMEKQLDFVARQQARWFDRPIDGTVLNQLQEGVRKHWSTEQAYLGLVQRATSVPDFGVSGRVTSSVVVPGRFTRAGLEGPVAEYGEWLDAVRGDPLLEECFPGEPPPALRDSVMSRYAQDYVGQWTRLMENLVLMMPSAQDQAGTKAILMQLSSTAAGNPLLDVLQNIDRNTQAPEGDGTVPGLQPATEAFADLRGFFTAPETGGAVGKSPHDHYLERLVLLAGAYPSDYGSQASDLRAWVDANYPASDPGDASPRGHVRFLLGTLLREVPDQLERGHQNQAVQQVENLWNEPRDEFRERFPGRFPFAAPDQPGCDRRDFERFFRQNGTFWEFHQGIASLVTRRGDLVAGAQPRISQSLRNALRKAEDIRRALFEGPEARFEFSVYPQDLHYPLDAGISWTLSVGGASVSYAGGGKSSQSVSWPGPNPADGASLSVAVDGASFDPLRFDGYWGLYKLLAAANKNPSNAGELDVTWTLPGRLDSGETKHLGVQILIRDLGTDNPLDPSLFDFSVPGRAVGP